MVREKSGVKSSVWELVEARFRAPGYNINPVIWPNRVVWRAQGLFEKIAVSESNFLDACSSKPAPNLARKKTKTKTKGKWCELLALSMCTIAFWTAHSPFSELAMLCNLDRGQHFFCLFKIWNTVKTRVYYSFSVRIVKKWNDLPKNVVHAGSLTLFR